MHSPANPAVRFSAWGLQVLALTAAYFVAGKLGILLAIPPGYATAIWPPSGIALAGILIYGNRVWPGILIGSFLVNLSTALGTDTPSPVLTSLLVTLTIASGAALQAIVGAYLVRRFAHFPNRFSSEKDIFLLFLFGGLLGSLVNATLSVSSLFLAGRVSPTNFLTNWGTWWLGDVLGVFIFTPLILVWALRPSEPWRERRMMVTVPVVLTFALTVIIVAHGADTERKKLASRFKQQTSLLAGTLEKTINTQMEILYFLRSFYESSNEVSRKEFHTFVNRRLKDAAGLQALSWNPRILSSERITLENGERHAGYPRFMITETNAEEQLVRAGERSEYVLVRYIEPYQGNENALGYDVASSPARKEALDQARDSGEIAATSKIPLVQGGQQTGILVFMPIYRNGLPHATLDERRANLTGYVTAVFREGDIVTAALKTLDTNGLIYQLLDETAASSEPLLFTNRQNAQPAFVLEEKGWFGGTVFLSSRSIIPVGGRQWVFQINATQDYFAKHYAENTWLILIAGLMLTGMTGVFTLVASGRRNQLLQLVDDRTVALRKSEIRLQNTLNETRKAKDLLENVLSSATEISIIATDSMGLITMFNRGAERMLGYTSEEMVGNETPVFIHLAEEVERRGRELELELGRPVSGFETFVTQVRRLGQETREWTYVCKDGTHLIASQTMTAIFNPRGEIEGYLAVAEDITERKQTEQALIQAKKAADNASKAKSEFLANMSHEIRTPMNAIIGLAQLALNKAVSPDVRDYLEKIGNASNSLLGILNDILDFSKIEAGHLSIDHSAFNLNVVVNNIHNLFVAHAEEKHLDFEVTVAADVPYDLLGDALRLQQVLVNLVGNAVKFTERGKISLCVSLEHKDQSQACLLFSVTDTGMGMSANDREKLFKPFSQVDGSITRRFGGTGLGLAISHQLLQLMGSEFRVESSPGQGTTFSFALIFDLSPTPVKRPLATEGNSNDQSKPLAGVRVLVAEDNLTNQLVVREFLQLAGVIVETANNGKEALELLDKGRFDAVLMDVHMPAMDGFEATKQIRHQTRFAQLPIIALTAGVTEEEHQACLASGMNDFIAKPVNATALMAGLLRWVKPDAAAAVPASLKPVATNPFGLDELQGFDLHNLLKMVDNNQDRVKQLLWDFREDLVGSFVDIEALLGAGNLASAAEWVHKIKGASGNIGAVALSTASMALEAELKNGQVNTATFSAFQREFDRAMSVIAGLSQSETPMSTGGVHSEALVRAATELDLLLKEGDFVSETVLNTFKALLPADKADFFKHLRKQVSAIQYAEARKMLHQFLASQDRQQS